MQLHLDKLGGSSVVFQASASYYKHVVHLLFKGRGCAIPQVSVDLINKSWLLRGSWGVSAEHVKGRLYSISSPASYPE